MKTVGIVAGKGGVGKSTVAVLLARALCRRGYRVGLLDADLYGPSIPLLIEAQTPPKWESDRLYPALGEGIKIVSMGYAERGSYVRAPIANGIIKQLATQVEWGEIDFLIVDFPPGTGDIPLSLIQSLQFTGAFVVTTPSVLSLADATLAGVMLQRMGVPILGVVENMAYMNVGEERLYPFGKEGGVHLAAELKTDLLESIPLDPSLNLPFFFDRLAQVISAAEREERVKGLFQRSPGALSIGWFDGAITEHLFSDLQKKCPCIRCREGERRVEEGVVGVKVEQVGSYGVRIDFSSGCSSGIYPYRLLRESL